MKALETYPTFNPSLKLSKEKTTMTSASGERVIAPEANTSPTQTKTKPELELVAGNAMAVGSLEGEVEMDNLGFSLFEETAPVDPPPGLCFQHYFNNFHQLFDKFIHVL